MTKRKKTTESQEWIVQVRSGGGKILWRDVVNCESLSEAEEAIALYTNSKSTHEGCVMRIVLQSYIGVVKTHHTFEPLANEKEKP